MSTRFLVAQVLLSAVTSSPTIQAIIPELSLPKVAPPVKMPLLSNLAILQYKIKSLLKLQNRLQKDSGCSTRSENASMS